jgi:hypothetical protein
MFLNDTTSQYFGITKTLRPNNQVFMSALVAVDPTANFKFSVILTNITSGEVTIDSTVPKDVSFVTIQRIA